MSIFIRVLGRATEFLRFLRQLVQIHARSLLLLLLGVILPLVIFEQLAVDVRGGVVVFPWDTQLLWAIHSTHQPDLDRFAEVLTNFGVYWGVFPLSIAIGLALLVQRRWRSLAFWIVADLGSVVINRTVKVLIHRVRPELWLSPAPEFDFGFPSGHAMSSMTLVAALVILTWGRRWCWLVSVIGGVFVVAIAWTRLYLGVHFPSDILAGWLVAVAWVVGVNLLIKPNAIPTTRPATTLTETTLSMRESRSLRSK